MPGTPPFPVLRQLQYEHKGEQLFESIYVMEPEDNPFYGAGMTDPCLVYRAKFLLDFRQMQVLVEYYEPVDSDAARDAAHDEACLNALRDRGRKACLVVFPDKAEQERLKKDFRKMSTADMDISRNRLSRWVGDMERNSPQLAPASTVRCLFFWGEASGPGGAVPPPRVFPFSKAKRFFYAASRYFCSR